MDNPTADITPIIHTLCTAPPTAQAACISTYFLPTATFVHPFVRVPSYASSRNLIHAIYRWYHFLSPHTLVNVESIAFDEANLILYATVRQVFRMRWTHFLKSDVRLTVKLGLVEREGKYYIVSQEDLYQTDQFLRFLAPLGVLIAVVRMLQVLVALGCAVCVAVIVPVEWALTEGWRRVMSGEARQRVQSEAGLARERLGVSVERARQQVEGTATELRRTVQQVTDGVKDGVQEFNERRAEEYSEAREQPAESNASSTGVKVEQFGNMQVVH